MDDIAICIELHLLYSLHIRAPTDHASHVSWKNGKYVPRKSGIPARAPNAMSPSTLEDLLRPIVTLEKTSKMLFRAGDFGHYLIEVSLNLRERGLVRLKRLLLGTLGFWWDLEALFGRVQDVLDLLEQTLVLLKLRIGLHGLLNQQLDVP